MRQFWVDLRKVSVTLSRVLCLGARGTGKQGFKFAELVCTDKETQWAGVLPEGLACFSSSKTDQFRSVVITLVAYNG